MILRAASLFGVLPFSFEDDGVHVDGASLVLPGDDIRARLDGATFCAVMTATCGLANERELQRLSALASVPGANGSDALLFDAAGSALAEAVADDPDVGRAEHVAPYDRPGREVAPRHERVGAAQDARQRDVDGPEEKEDKEVSSE